MVKMAKMRLLEFSRGHCKFTIPFEPNKNHLGTMYAGALFTLSPPHSPPSD